MLTDNYILNKNSLKAVKKAQPSKVETIGMMHIY